MLELKFAIYHGPGLSSQASSVDACSIGWRIIDQALFKHRVNNNNEWQTLPVSMHPMYFLFSNLE